MKNPLIYLAIAAVLAACRGGGSGSLQRKDQQNYDVVQEGQASGVTSTINAPGEPVPPPAAMTGTNADTTSNFALPQVATSTTSTGQPGTIAGTLPQDTSGSMTVGYPTGMPPRPRVTPRPPQPVSRPPATRTDTTSTTLEGPPPSTSTVSPNTDTAPPPPSDTTGTTAPKEKKEKEKKPSDENPPPPTQTDTQPPPTSTTTGV